MKLFYPLKYFPLAILLFFFAHFSYAQSKVHTGGIIIKFKGGITYQQQSEILKNFSQLQLFDEKENALLPKISLAKFNIQNISDSEIREIKNELEKYDEVLFVNPLLVTGSGHFSAPLGEFYVKLFSKNDFSKLESLAKESNTKILREYEYMPNVFILAADKNSKGNSKELAKYFSDKKLFRYASPNMMFTLEDCSPNDQLYNRQWAIENTGSSFQYYGTPDADMDVDSAWTITTGDSTIKIAVLDSGTDTTHQDLVGNLLPGYDATGGNSNGYMNTTYPEDGHGTCTAGIIAAIANNSVGIAGVAYNCRVVPVRMFYYLSFQGQVLPFSTNQWGLDAINWAWQTAKVDIMSNSWGIPDSLMSQLGIDTTVSNDAIDSAVANGRNGKGLPMLFSAGNAPDTFCLWPARTPATIAVAATTMCDELKTMTDCSPENFWASNHGTNLDISAPGVKIASTDITGSKGFASGNYYLSFNGTSAACPNAAGVMALMLSANKNLTEHEARDLISLTCDKVGGYSYNVNGPSGSWSMELGYGRVNAYRAVQAALVAGTSDFRLPTSDFQIYPNPNDGKFVVQIANHYRFTDYELEIYNVLGERIYKSAIYNHQSSIDLSNHPAGIYFIKIQAGEKVSMQKIIVQ